MHSDCERGPAGAGMLDIDFDEEFDDDFEEELGKATSIDSAKTLPDSLLSCTSYEEDSK
jgi:archaellum component FlaC